MARGKITSVSDTPEGRRYKVALDDGDEREVGDDDIAEPGDAEEKEKPAATKALSEAKWFQYDLEGGVITINEYRATKGLPPDERFGRMTLPEYMAAQANVYATAQAARSGALAPRPGGASETMGGAAPNAV